MAIQIRKTGLQIETTLIEGGKAAAVPLKLFTAFAVVKNPWAGRGFVEDLKPEIHAGAPVLGELLTKMIIDAVGSGDAVEAYGKAAVVGLDGEIEHASALIHTCASAIFIAMPSAPNPILPSAIRAVLPMRRS